MDRRYFLGLAAAAPFALPAAVRAAAYSDAAYKRAIVIDGQGVVNDPYGKETDIHFSPQALAEIRASGLTACSMTVNEVGNSLNAWNNTIQSIAGLDQAIADNPEVQIKALSAADIRRAKDSGRIAIIYNTQDTSLVGPELDRVTLLKGLGVRIVQLTYNNRNLSGDGCLEPANAGLSKLGRATIARIEKEKLLLDLAHSGQRTVAEGVAAATRPMTISHTGCRDLHDNPRNQYDAELRACANKGGVVGIYWMPFLVPNGKPTGADLVRHMDHALNVCGEDHVSIGTDNILYKTVIDDKARAFQKKFFEDRTARGIAAPGEGPDIFNIVAEWDSHMRFRMLADGLAKAGWSSARIDKVLGGNLMRLYAEVWGA
ncbi:dipeptidase [Sphingomonas tabacisoli]|uniref:Dipeptidase n=1 Tax=Sphingomonas tabacisoli TaxID=2249466 RepID=A0ABW4I3P0_9SPHN